MWSAPAASVDGDVVCVRLVGPVPAWLWRSARRSSFTPEFIVVMTISLTPSWTIGETSGCTPVAKRSSATRTASRMARRRLAPRSPMSVRTNLAHVVVGAAAHRHERLLERLLELEHTVA